MTMQKFLNLIAIQFCRAVEHFDGCDLLHDDHKTLLGRPNITVLIDHYSHMVLGFQLSFEKPSFASVCIACINAKRI